MKTREESTATASGWYDTFCGACLFLALATVAALFIVMIRFLWIGGSAIAASSCPCQ